MARFTRDDGFKVLPGASLWIADGLGVRCSAGGVHSWVQRYTFRGRRRWITLDRLGNLTLSQAKDAAKEVRAKIAKDIDPLERKLGKGLTVEAFSKTYLERHATPHKKKSSVDRDKELLRLHIVPQLGARMLADVCTDDVRLLHASLASTPVRANRVASLLSSMFDRAMAWNLMPKQENPAFGRTDYYYPETKRQRYLTVDEYKRLWKTLDELEATPARDFTVMIRLLLLTGCRRSEITKLKWSEVRLAEKALHLPRAKNGFRVVTLTAQAVKILKAIPHRNESEWVFPGIEDDKKPRGGFERAWEHIRTAAKLEEFRCHDLRHSYASAAVRAGVPLHAIAGLLGHASTSTSARYAHIPTSVSEATAKAVGDKLAALTRQPLRVVQGGRRKVAR